MQAGNADVKLRGWKRDEDRESNEMRFLHLYDNGGTSAEGLTRTRSQFTSPGLPTYSMGRKNRYHRPTDRPFRHTLLFVYPMRSKRALPQESFST
jgi:hypothetical protein